MDGKAQAGDSESMKNKQTTEATYADNGFWSYQPAAKPATVKVDPIDAFLALDTTWTSDPELAHLNG